jgi:hypothetical protein
VPFAGIVSRVCLGGGEWGSVDTFACRREEIQEVSREVSRLILRGCNTEKPLACAQSKGYAVAKSSL